MGCRSVVGDEVVELAVVVAEAEPGDDGSVAGDADDGGEGLVRWWPSRRTVDDIVNVLNGFGGFIAAGATQNGTGTSEACEHHRIT